MGRDVNQAIEAGRETGERALGRRAVASSPAHAGHPVRVLTVGSGKGGVGKSSVVVNLALAFDRMGQRVLIIDGDLGLANIHVLLGLTPKYNISHMLSGRKLMGEVLINGPGRVRIVPAGSGAKEVTQLSDEQKLIFLEILDGLESEIDVLLIDTGSGISDTVLYFNLAAQEKIILVNPEPGSISDACALIEILHTRYRERHFKILVNSATSEKAGKSIYAKVCKAADRFLDGLSLDYLGSIPYDPRMLKAVKKQKALVEAFPEAPAAKAFMRIAGTLQRTPPDGNHGTVQFFWNRSLIDRIG